MTSKSSEDLKTGGKGRKRTRTTVNSSVCSVNTRQRQMMKTKSYVSHKLHSQKINNFRIENALSLFLNKRRPRISAALE